MLTPLRRARLDADRTLFDMQRLTRIPMSRLSMIERLLVEPKEDEMRRLSAALGHKVDDLFAPDDSV